MTALDQNPTDVNFLPTNNFRFILRRAPNIQFFVQRANLPGIHSGPITVPSPYIGKHVQGGPVEHDYLEVEFKVQEDMSDYLEIFNWLIKSTYSKSLEDYGELKNQPKYSDAGVESQVTLMILNSAKVPQFEIVFEDAFPTALTGIDFDSSSDTVNYPVVRATFDYQFFTINNLKVA